MLAFYQKCTQISATLLPHRFIVCVRVCTTRSYAGNKSKSCSSFWLNLIAKIGKIIIWYLNKLKKKDAGIHWQCAGYLLAAHIACCCCHCFFFANWQTNSLRRSQLTGWSSKTDSRTHRETESKSASCRMCVGVCAGGVWHAEVFVECVFRVQSAQQQQQQQQQTTVGRQCQKNWSSRKYFTVDGTWAVFFMQTDCKQKQQHRQPLLTLRTERERPRESAKVVTSQAYKLWFSLLAKSKMSLWTQHSVDWWEILLKSFANKKYITIEQELQIICVISKPTQNKKYFW